MPELTTFSGRRPAQHISELRPMVDLFLEYGVRRYLEIGARHGDTFHYVMNRLPGGSFGLAVDLPGGPWGISSSVGALAEAVFDLNQNGIEAEYLLGDSTDDDIIHKVSDHAPFDAILIDGDHRLEGVRKDWLNYGGMAPLVAFHDIVPGAVHKHFGPVEVPQFWAELKGDYQHWEFIQTKTDRPMGIGVIRRADPTARAA